MIALQLSRESYFVLPSATDKDVTFKLDNALLPKCVTLAGSSNVVNPQQQLNAYSSIDVTVLGIVTDVIPYTEQNADFPIFTTV